MTAHHHTAQQQAVLASFASRLTVSCQAYPGEPMLDPRTMTQIAQAAVIGGAAAIRAKGLDDITGVVAAVDVPVVGLVKVGDQGVFITPTLDDALAVAATGCEIVALDGTRRDRPDGRSLVQTVAGVVDAHAEVLVMADCGSLDDARAAIDAGAHIVGTTLGGYTGERPRTEGPDWEFLDQVLELGVPVVAEGRFHTPAQAAEAIRRGAHSVCVGTAITHPSTITSWFVEALPSP